MLKAGDLARWEDHRVRGGSKAGEPDEIGGYHMYGLEHVLLLGNSRTRQNATISSLKVSLNWHN